MAYVKNTPWAQRQGTGLNRYTKTAETANHVYLTNDPVALTDAGTSFSVTRMQHMEDGIFQNSLHTRRSIADGITLDASSVYVFNGALDISGSIDIPETTLVKFFGEDE